MSDAGSAPSARRSRRIEVATLLTVVGLLLTFVFNALGEWRGAQQEKEQRITQQISLITELDASAGATQKAIVATGLLDCGYSGKKLYLKAQDELLAALGYYEYLAWLFNHRHLTIGREHFALRLIGGLRFAEHYVDKRYYDRETFDEDFRELRRFATKSREQPRDPC